MATIVPCQLRRLTLELSWGRRCDAGPAPCRITQGRAPARWHAVGPQLERRVRPRPRAAAGRHALFQGLGHVKRGTRGPSRAMLAHGKTRPPRPQPNTHQGSGAKRHRQTDSKLFAALLAWRGDLAFFSRGVACNRGHSVAKRHSKRLPADPAAVGMTSLARPNVLWTTALQS